MNARIGIDNAEFYAFHGYYPGERKSGHVYYVTAWAEIGYSDHKEQILANTVNYEDIYRICKSEMNNPQVLLETVAANMLNQMKTEFPGIRNAFVRICKKGAQLGGKVNCAFIEMKF